MYSNYFGFAEKPFNITPDPAYIFLSKLHQEAFAHLLYGIDNHVGFIELIGEVGTGKTTVLRTLLNQLDAKGYRTAIIFNPCLSSSGLLQNINREYGLPYQNLDNEELIDVLNRFLVKQNADGNTVVLVIDEAQNLKQDVLEQIRLISNLETERDKLIQIVLAGQPELKQLLKKTELRQLDQRIMVRYYLQPMDFEDTRDYINHRIKVAGAKYSDTFTTGALRKIFRFSGGFPRLINIVCDRALLLGYTKGLRQISAGMVSTAIKDIRQTEKPRLFQVRFYTLGLMLLAIILAAAVFAVPERFTGRTKPRSFTTASSKQRKDMNPSLPNFPGAVRSAMSGLTEAESAIRGLNVLARLWKVPSFSVPVNSVMPLDLDRIASERSLQFTRFSGNLGALVRLNSPALLELTIPGVSGKRYLALTGVENGRLIVAPAILGRNCITGSELDSIWSGRSYLLWKNSLNIPPGLKPGTRGEAPERLQSLLKGAGVYRGRLTGVFDQATIDAVKNFQINRGIEPDGLAGKQTLLLLYRSAGGFFSPELVKREGRQEG